MLARKLYEEMTKEGDPTTALVLADLLEETGYATAAGEARHLARELEKWGTGHVSKELLLLLGRPERQAIQSPYIVTLTYETVAEDEVESGIDAKDVPMPLRGVMQAVEALGSWGLDHLPFDPVDAARRRYIGIYGDDNEEDYRTGRRTTHQVHVHGTSSAILRLGKILEQRWR